MIGGGPVFLRKEDRLYPRRLGRVGDAIAAYKKSLELDPDNENARRMLKELGAYLEADAPWLLRGGGIRTHAGRCETSIRSGELMPPVVSRTYG
jgi:hypothetical protein